MTVTAKKIIEQGLLNYYVNDSNRVEQARQQLILTHPNSEGVVAIGIKPDGKWSQAHLSSDELLLIMDRFLGIENVYLSQGSFQDTRSITSLRQINTLFVDLDFYKNGKDYTSEEICRQFEANEYNRSIPQPSLVINSGRGLTLIWLIEPTPAADLPLWQSIEDYLIYSLRDYGSDPAARDAARVLRLAGTINSKSGKMAEFIQIYNSEYRYSLKNIATQYLAVNEPKKDITTSQYKASKKVGRIFNIYTLHYERLKDLERLQQFRFFNGDDCHGYREIMCFLFRYWMCCYTSNPTQSLNETMLFNTKFIKPLTEGEVVNATKSAEKGWENWLDNIDTGGNLKDRNNKTGYNYRNRTLIGLLSITAEEQKQLKTIISTEEKYRRSNENRYKQRRYENGLTQKQLARQCLIAEVKKMYDDGNTQTQIANKLGISQASVSLYINY